MSGRPPFHWLRLRATVHATEDPARVRDALRYLSGLDETAFEAATTATHLESHYGSEVQLLETEIKRPRLVLDALDRLLAGRRSEVAAQLDQRLDDEQVFYLRFDKQAASQGRTLLFTGDDAIQVRTKVEAHPAHRENVLRALRRVLQDPDDPTAAPASPP